MTILEKIISSKTKELKIDGLFIAIGHDPATSLFKDQLKMDNEGYLIQTEIENNNTEDYNINYSTWTADIGLNWWFAPGSQLSLVWKNGVDNQTSNIENNWFENVEESFNLAQQNSLSLKIVYYLDYLYLKKGI